MDKKKACLIISTCMMLLLLVAIGPLDVFTHGFFCEVVDYAQIPVEDRLGYVSLTETAAEVRFMPLNEHFAGFMLYFLEVSDEDTGMIRLTVFDEEGETVDEMTVAINEISEGWYRVYTDKELKKDHIYTLHIAAQDHQAAPCLPMVDPGYLGEEAIAGRLLIGYAYAEPTFSFVEKVLLVLFIISVWLIVCSDLVRTTQVVLICRNTALFLFLTAVLSWNFMFGSMDGKNTGFAGFQMDSETLVTGVIYAEHDDVGSSPYGLGRYSDIMGDLTGYGRSFVSDGEWDNGYSKIDPKIRIVDHSYAQKVAVVGNYIQTIDGEIFQIDGVEQTDGYRTISLQAESPLSYSKYGDLTDIRFLGPDKKPLAAGLLKPYVSQFGLQGKVFRHLARYLEYEDVVTDLHLLCSLAAASVFVLIVILLSRKYGLLFAACSYVVFWLSPWIVNFAKNLYWVEATWFLPMLIGLFCSWKIEDKRCRTISYIGAFIAVTGKCLCGYEYISTIMMGMIGSLLVDLIMAISIRDKGRCRLLSKTIVVMGVAALAGFMTAITIHARLRGEGDIAEGIKDIFEQDVLRRVGGGDMNEFAEILWPSLNASIWETCRRYFHFSTQVITGVEGNLFPLLCIVPLGIFWWDHRKKCLDLRLPVMYIVSFLTSISWYVLARAHSYIHVHINYVLWYFGFVQVCIYVVCNKFWSVISSVRAS